MTTPADMLLPAIEESLNVDSETEGRFMVGRFIMAVEIFDSQGEPYITHIASNGLSIWDKIGMLRFTEARIEKDIRGEEDG